MQGQDFLKHLATHSHDSDPKVAAKARVLAALLPGLQEAIENERSEKDSSPGILAMALSAAISYMVMEVLIAGEDTGQSGEGKDVLKELINLDIDELYERNCKAGVFKS